MATIKEILAQARLPETTVDLCLRGDLMAQWRQLQSQLETADTTAPCLGQRAPARVIAEQMEDLRQQMASSTITVRLRALPAREWSAFAATRPQPSSDDDDPDQWREQWFAWVAALVARCAIDPEMTAEQVGQLCDGLSGVQWDELSNAAWALNETRMTIPFSAAAYALIRDTEPT